MSYPPPPGLNTSHPPASLPSRPPPSAVGSTPAFKSASGSVTKPSFTAFAPRTVANTYRTNSPAQFSAPAVPSYSQGAQYPPAPGGQPQYDSSYAGAPQIRNPFVPASEGGAAATPYPGFDPDYEAQVQQWQSAYMSKDAGNSYAARPVPTGSNSTAVATPTHKEPTSREKDDAANKTVHREGGGSNWTDSTLLEWDPAHFRIFVGNLAGETTDDSLLKAFAQYPSVQKARVIRDKRTTKSKGYGFVSFSDGDDYFRAARDMAGKYIGSHPVTIKKANTDVRPTTVKQNHKGKGKGAGGHGKVQHDGIEKKQPKTKGGLKLLG